MSPQPEPAAGAAPRLPSPHLRSLPTKQVPALADAVDLIWETDSNLAFTQFSTQFCERLPKPPVRLLATSDGDGLIKADGRLVERSDLDDVMARRAFRGLACRLSAREASYWLKLSGTPVIDANGIFRGYRGIGVEITTEVEQWLRANRTLRNYVDVIETISEGLAYFDADDRLAICNRQYRDIHEKLGDVIRHGAHFEDIARAAANHGVVSQAAGGEDAWVRERLKSHRNPGPPSEQLLDTGRWLLISERKTSDGGTVSVRTDITDLKRRELALKESEARADLANRAKSEFLANMSHELRTPLNAVIGFSEALESGVFGKLPEKQVAYIRDIHSAGTHLLALINEILDISKVEAGHIELSRDRVDLNDVIRDCLRLVSPKAVENVLKLQPRLEDRPLILWADQQRLKQIVLNLLSNAIKFTPAGGRVTVETAVAAGQAVVLRISDTGIGIRPSDIPRCFEPFFQVEGPLVRSHHGTGLGLPLAKRLIECHDGGIEIESELGCGTAITVRFPTHRSKPAPGRKK